MNTPKKIFVTGGHLTPAIAVIDEIRRRNVPWEIVFIGRKRAMEGVSDRSHEEDVMASYGIRFLPLTAGRLQRTFTAHSIKSFCKVPVGCIQAWYYCWKEKPVCILSFGGYVAVPIVISAAFFHIPVITHEQTTVSGLANTIIAYFAKKVCVTFEETLGAFPKNKVVVTGLPVRKELFESVQPPFPVDEKKYPIIYITGGSTGSVSLNDVLFPLVPRLIKHCTVIHQTGGLSAGRAFQVKRMLSSAEQVRYIVHDYFGAQDVAWILQHATLVIGRSGANTVMEIAMLGKMALFVPLPWAGSGEQMQNAQWLVKMGSAQVLPQKEASPEKILHNIEQMIAKKHIYIEHAKKISRLVPRDGDKRVADELMLVVNRK